MSLLTWIEEAVAKDFDFSTTGIVELKESCYRMYHLLSELMNADSKRRQQLRKFKSVTAFEAAKSLEKAYPDRFYNFSDREVSISIVRFERTQAGLNIGALYYVSCSGFKPDVKMYQDYIRDFILKPIGQTELNPNDFHFSNGFNLYGGYDEASFDEIKTWFRIFVDMYLSRSF